MSVTPIGNVPTVLRGGSAQQVQIPAAGSWLAVASDSNGDRTVNSVGMALSNVGITPIEYGSVITNLCARYGWNVVNENFIANGSFEGVFMPALSGCDGPSGFWNCNASTDTNAATLKSGAKSFVAVANATTANGMYAVVGGAAPAILTGTAPVGGVITTPPTIFYAGRSMTGPTLTVTPVGAGSGAVLSCIVLRGQFNAVRVDAGGSGYTSGATIAVDANSCTDLQMVHGSGATFTATVAGGVITGVTITNAGAGYPDTPTWTGVPSNGVGTNQSGGMFINPSGQCTATSIFVGGSGLTAAPNIIVGNPGPRYRNDSPMASGYNLGLPSMQPGEVWTLQGWVTGGGITGGNVYLQVIGAWPGSANGARQALATASSTANPPTATKVSVTFTVPTGFGSMEIRVGTTGTITNGTSAVWLDGLQLVRGNAGPATYDDYLTQRGGYASQTFSQAPGGFNLTFNIFPRVTQHTQTNVVLLWHFINDLGSASGAVAVGNRVTIAGLSADLDTVFTAINGMANQPLVIMVGLGPWAQTTWSATPPTGYLTYEAFASDMELLLQRKAIQYGAVFIPLRKHMDFNSLLTTSQSNQVHISPAAAKMMADIIAAYLEGRMY